jgi:RimJ/RimL family protein N-acetyltransferase
MNIQGNSITLSKFQKKDINDQYLCWLNDKEVVKYSNQRFIEHNYLNAQKYLESFSQTNNLFLSIRLSSNQQIIGTMTVYFTFHNTADIGIMIGDKSLWGKGYGKDAWVTMISWLENELKIRKITAGTIESNKGMLKLLKESKMSLEATRKNHEIIDNHPEDVLYFCKFNNINK